MRRALIFVPIVLSSLVLGAHLFRAGQVWLAIVAAALPLLLVGRRPWSTRLLQLALALGAVEWIRTLVALVEHRQLLGQPYARLVAILAVVAGVTALSAYLAGRLAAPARLEPVAGADDPMQLPSASPSHSDRKLIVNA